MQIIKYDVAFGRTLESKTLDLAAAKTWLDEHMTTEFLRGNFVQMSSKSSIFEPEGGVTCHVIVTKTEGANTEISHHIFEKMTYAVAEEIWQQYWSHSPVTSRDKSKQTAYRSDFVDEPENCFDEW